jgi:hypothetical protein
VQWLPSFFRSSSLVGRRSSSSVIGSRSHRPSSSRTGFGPIHSSEEEDKSDTFVYVLEYVPSMSSYLLTILKMHKGLELIFRRGTKRTGDIHDRYKFKVQVFIMMCKLIKCPKLRCYVFCYGDFGYVYCLKEAIHQNAVTAKQRPRNKHFIYSSIRYILDILQLLRSVYGIHIGPTLFHYVDHACAIWWHAAIAVSFFYMSQYFFHHVDHACSMDVKAVQYSTAGKTQTRPTTEYT